MASSDEAVRETNDDAAISKLSAIQLGYWSDPFLPLLIHSTIRRPPIINRGYFVRVEGIRNFVRTFIEDCVQLSVRPQIVSLGAGFDTTFFCMKEEFADTKLKYIELDFNEVAARKIHSIVTHKKLLEAIGATIEEPIEEASGSKKKERELDYVSEEFSVLGVDLRQTAALRRCLERAELDVSSPVLVLAECVLVYLEPEEGDAILSVFAECEDVVFVEYDPLHPSDPFGKTMMKNLRERGCVLRSIEAYGEKVTTIKRYTSAGFNEAACETLQNVRPKPQRPPQESRKEKGESKEDVGGRRLWREEELERAWKCEWLDELEEWELLQSHYAITCAVKSTTKMLCKYPKLLTSSAS